MEQVATQGVTTLYQYGAIGVMLVVTLLALAYIIKKTVFDNGENTKKLGVLIESLVIKIDARDEMLVKTIEYERTTKGHCFDELIERMDTHHKETVSEIKELKTQMQIKCKG